MGIRFVLMKGHALLKGNFLIIYRVSVLKIYFYRMMTPKVPIYERGFLNSDIVRISFFNSLTLVTVPVIRLRSREVKILQLKNTWYR